MAHGFAVDEVIPPKRFADNPLDYQEVVLQAREHLQDAVKALLRNSAERTDLMNAFQLASKIFTGEQCRHIEEKILIVFSDMVEQSSRWDFTRMHLTPECIEKIIRTEKTEGRLPVLTSVKVWVTGATAAPGAGLPPEKIYEIQNFWIQYFKACGADLAEQRYGPSLLNFHRKEPQTKR